MGSIIAIANAITTTILSGGGFVPPTPPADGIITETSPGVAPFDYILAETGEFLEQE
jgi:hypothetical protein|tara:strand:+ start:391 stop:561 length:171 start_codon:yes stop_codon:yes gene_type:complete